jgi:pimeloyl-ACP methyl ester carboxylesterase
MFKDLFGNSVIRGIHEIRLPDAVSYLAAIILCMILLTNCTKAGVRPVDLDDRFVDMRRSALTTGSLSERTSLFLRRMDLTKSWKKDPLATLKKLDQKFNKKPDRDTLFALMELCFFQAKKARANSEEAPALKLACAYYAYVYLFDKDIGQALSPFHSHSRLACDFYNRSLAGFLVDFRDGNGRYEENMRLPFFLGHLNLKIGHFELKWWPSDFDHFFITYEFEPKDLENHIKTEGLGVPIIAGRVLKAAEERKGQDRFLPTVLQTYAATILLRFSRPDNVDQNTVIPYTAEMDIYDPMKTLEIRIGNRDVLLETDLTIPLAYRAEHSKVPSGISGLFKVESWENQQGLHMFQPYDPNKIPLVFVHGLMDTPLTWLKMVNNLLADSRIRHKYQFWFFMYPTGNPILYSASILRESLKETRRLCDPEGDDPAFHDLVLVGYSMGGLLSKFMIMDSGEVLWNEISDVPVSDPELTPDQQMFIQRILFFERLPFVSRVIFIAVPHRGSKWASRPVSQWGASLVKLPASLTTKSYSMLKAIGQDEKNRLKMKIEKLPTGIEALQPDSIFVTVSNRIPLPDNIPYHSIIGNRKAADTPGGTDGLVPYESSHLEGAVSEKIVRSGHGGVNKNPLTIEEVRRILYEHLDAVRNNKALQ